ncbi:MAG: hypothetical protein AMXMBFR6_07470 [Betaproteobacteria bacterium]|jgi:cell division protein FtsQ|nr:cell division protein FtsQ/DivIB [Rhodocyclaceae bacterium]
MAIEARRADHRARHADRRGRKGSAARTARAGDTVGLWDRPQALNLAADLLHLVGLAGLAWAVVLGMSRLPLGVPRMIVVTTPVTHVTVEQISFAAKRSITGNYFSMDVDVVRQAMERLPWVRRADVRRVWPDRIELALEEHVPVARWRPADGAEARLVNRYGEVFQAASDLRLPSYWGPEGTAELIVQRARDFEQRLAALGSRIDAITLSPRLSWQIRLANGTRIELGRDDRSQPERLATMVRVLTDDALALPVKAVTIDLRYRNGFALRPAPGADKGA